MWEYKARLEHWYDRTAENYDSWGSREGEYSTATAPIEIATFRTLLARTSLNTDSRILDVGTGTGIYLLEALRQGGIGYGVDISNKMITQFKKKVKKLGLQKQIKALKKGDAESLDFPSKFFDVVICIGVLEYYPLEVVKKCLAEMKRVAKPQSKFIVDFPRKDNAQVFEFQKKERSIGHEVFIYDRKKIDSFLKQNGFMILKSAEAGIENQYLMTPKREVRAREKVI